MGTKTFEIGFERREVGGKSRCQMIQGEIVPQGQVARLRHAKVRDDAVLGLSIADAVDFKIFACDEGHRKAYTL